MHLPTSSGENSVTGVLLVAVTEDSTTVTTGALTGEMIIMMMRFYNSDLVSVDLWAHCTQYRVLEVVTVTAYLLSSSSPVIV